jgi:hypothetical protein
MFEVAGGERIGECTSADSNSGGKYLRGRPGLRFI